MKQEKQQLESSLKTKWKTDLQTFYHVSRFLWSVSLLVDCQLIIQRNNSTNVTWVRPQYIKRNEKQSPVRATNDHLVQTVVLNIKYLLWMA